jgi:hypothetical protein
MAEIGRLPVKSGVTDNLAGDTFTRKEYSVAQLMGERAKSLGLAVALSLLCLTWVATAWGQRKAGKIPKSVNRADFVASAAGAAWLPPDVDAAVPSVDTSTPCPMEDVLKAAGQREVELVNTLPQFTATERMEHFEADSKGSWGKPKVVSFHYLVEMQQVRAGMLVMDETRDGRKALDKFPAHLATLGLPAVAMVFHPFYVKDYTMKCEGMGAWDGHSAWQIHFQQRPDKYPRLRGYRIREMSYPVKLKGRAWIDADTFQVLHIETDLMEPIPQIPLLREHLSVDYRPVHFKKENSELWLQQSAEVYMDYRGHHYRRKHVFSDFLLFSVDVDQKDATPTGH